MPVWTLVVGERPTYAFAAENYTKAERHLEENGVKDDLSYYEDGKGNSLWDGEASLLLRPATPVECRTWRQAQEKRHPDSVTNPEDNQHRATYLVDLHDPAEDEILLV